MTNTPYILEAWQQLCDLMQEDDGTVSHDTAKCQSSFNPPRPLPSLPPPPTPLPPCGWGTGWQGSHMCFYSRPGGGLDCSWVHSKGHIMSCTTDISRMVCRGVSLDTLRVKIHGQETTEPGPEHPGSRDLTLSSTLFLSCISLADSPRSTLPAAFSTAC